MKIQIVNGALLGSLITLLIACNGPKEEPAPVAIDKDQIKQEIQAKENEFAAAYNKGEMKSIGYFADDATSYFQNRAPLVGKQAIIEFLKADLNENSNSISFTTNEVFVSNDAAQVVEIGSFKLVDSAQATLNTGNYMTLFEKRDGKYVSVRDMSASDIPLK
jgi:ketosteroid isomerase-like protein